MISGKVKIDIYGWEVSLFMFECPEDVAVYKKMAKHKTGEQKDTDEMLDEVSKGFKDGGLTVSYNDRTTHILIHPTKTSSKLMNILMHEKRHAEDFIIEYLCLSGGESLASLSGYLGEKLIEIATNSKNISKR